MGKARFNISELKRMGYVEENGTFVRKCVTRISTSDRKISKSGKKCLKNDLFVLLVFQQLKVEILPEYRFDSSRRWRFDYAIPSAMIAVEVEGGVWSNGRHTRGKGYLGDMEKYNRANVLGWRLIRVTPQELTRNTTLDRIREYLN